MIDVLEANEERQREARLVFIRKSIKKLYSFVFIGRDYGLKLNGNLQKVIALQP